jgi:hypothetical protein
VFIEILVGPYARHGAVCTAVGQLLEDLYAAVQGPNVPFRIVFVDERIFALGSAMLKLNLH